MSNLELLRIEPYYIIRDVLVLVALSLGANATFNSSHVWQCEANRSYQATQSGLVSVYTHDGTDAGTLDFEILVGRNQSASQETPLARGQMWDSAIAAVAPGLWWRVSARDGDGNADFDTDVHGNVNVYWFPLSQPRRIASEGCGISGTPL